jgi:hypothetical protein
VQALKPLPHRGDLVAAGAVPLVAAVALINIRMAPVWANGVLFLVDLVAGGGLLAIGLLADPEPRATDRGGTGPGRPRPYNGVLLLGGLLLSYQAVVRLSQILGADSALGSPGQVFWVTAALAAAALALWRARRLAVLVLVAAIAVAVAVFAFVVWVFDPDGAQTFRWVSLLLILGFIGVHLVVRERLRREAVLMVDAAGLVAFLLAYTLAIDLIGSISPLAGAAGVDTSVPAGWALVCFAAAFGLVAFSALEREPGPGFLGVAVLAVTVGITAASGIEEPSLVGWPLVLLVLGVGGLAFGLRPARELPPPPDAPGGPGETVDLPPRP